MIDYKQMILTGIFCEGCGVFINGEPSEEPRKCVECHEEELIQAVEEDIMPDGILFMDWIDIKRKYSEPEIRA